MKNKQRIIKGLPLNEYLRKYRLEHIDQIKQTYKTNYMRYHKSKYIWLAENTKVRHVFTTAKGLSDFIGYRGSYVSLLVKKKAIRRGYKLYKITRKEYQKLKLDGKKEA